MPGLLSQVVVMQLATLLYWVMVAQTMVARRSLLGLFPWDQVEPRQWWDNHYLPGFCLGLN